MGMCFIHSQNYDERTGGFCYKCERVGESSHEPEIKVLNEAYKHSETKAHPVPRQLQQNKALNCDSSANADSQS